MLNQDIIREATRLTRAGQLVEATALLQRMLRGERAPDGAIAYRRSHRVLQDASRPSLTRRPMTLRRRDRLRQLDAGQLRTTARAPAVARSRKGRAPGSDCEA